MPGPDIRRLTTGVVYQDDWMRLRRDEIERRDGSRGSYAFVEKRDFALVIPAENDGFHLVEEYRYPIGRRTWSFPQGGFGRGESGSPEDLARLELAQETGLRARELVRLGYLHAAHGTSSQAGYYFLATGLSPGPTARETEEQDMRQAWVSRARFEEMISQGLITDDSTVAAYTLLLLAERKPGPGAVRSLGPRPGRPGRPPESTCPGRPAGLARSHHFPGPRPHAAPANSMDGISMSPPQHGWNIHVVSGPGPVRGRDRGPRAAGLRGSSGGEAPAQREPRHAGWGLAKAGPGLVPLSEEGASP